MNYLLKYTLGFVLIFCSCTMKTDNKSIEKWKNEILETEQQFAEMTIEKGIDSAFLEFTAEDAVLMRNNNLVIGKNAIKNHFENQTTKNTNELLTWKPDFVEVAASGDLGYTYGNIHIHLLILKEIKTKSRGFFILFGKDKKMELGNLFGID
jgi:ketosteroid isomerase-like protein